MLGLRAGSVRAIIGEQPLLVGGDILLSAAGVEVTPDPASLDQMRSILGTMPPGDSVVARVLRGGTVVRLSALKPR